MVKLMSTNRLENVVHGIIFVSYSEHGDDKTDIIHQSIKHLEGCKAGYKKFELISIDKLIGNVVDSDLVAHMLKLNLGNELLDSRNEKICFIINGFPKTRAQAAMFTSLIEQMPFKILHCIYLGVRNQTTEICEYFAPSGCLTKIDSLQDESSLLMQITNQLKQLVS
jgi:hypothetical protein